MPESGNADIADALRVEFKVKGKFGGLSIGNEVVPVALVSDIRSSVGASAYPKDAFGFVAEGAGGVGTNVQLGIQSNPGRGLIYQITGVVIDKSTGGTVMIRVSRGVALGTALGAQSTKAFQDQRHLTTVPDAVIGSNSVLTANIDGSQVMEVRFPAAGNVLVPLNVILGGLDYCLVVNETPNETMGCSWLWTEYLLEDR